ncbi:MAG: glycosyltransferase family 25 protein [Roseovarius sp.]
MRAHAFILHLPRATARRENAHALLESCGLPGEIWQAVDGRALSEEERAGVLGERLFEPPYPFPLNPGEIGVFLSQRAIWAEIVARGLDAGLIFEDDVALDTGTFAEALVLADDHAQAYGYLQLQNRPPEGAGAPLATRGPCRLTQPQVTPLRASAQLVTRKAAERLLARSERFDRPIDTFVQSHWHTGLRPAVIYPAGVRTISDALEGSTIQGGKRGLGEKLTREIRRFRYRRRIARLSATSPAPDRMEAAP